VLQKQGSYERDGRVVIFDVLGPESELGTISPDGKSQWIGFSLRASAAEDARSISSLSLA